MDRHPDDAAEFVPPARRVPRQLTRWWESEIAHMQHLFARAVAWTATRAWQVTADWRAVRPIISRASAHLAILLLAVAAILLSGLNLPSGESPADASQEGPVQGAAGVSPSAVVIPEALSKAVSFAPKTEAGAATNGAVPVNGNHHQSDGDATIVRLAQPITVIPNRPRLGLSPTPCRRATQSRALPMLLTCNQRRSCGPTRNWRNCRICCVSVKRSSSCPWTAFTTPWSRTIR